MDRVFYEYFIRNTIYLNKIIIPVKVKLKALTVPKNDEEDCLSGVGKSSGNKAVYTAYVAPSRLEKTGNARTDQRTDRRTHALIQSLCRD